MDLLQTVLLASTFNRYARNSRTEVGATLGKKCTIIVVALLVLSLLGISSSIPPFASVLVGQTRQDKLDTANLSSQKLTVGVSPLFGGCTSVAVAPSPAVWGQVVRATSSTTCSGAQSAQFIWHAPDGTSRTITNCCTIGANGQSFTEITVDVVGTWSVEVDIYNTNPPSSGLIDLVSQSFIVGQGPLPGGGGGGARPLEE